MGALFSKPKTGPTATQAALQERQLQDMDRQEAEVRKAEEQQAATRRSRGTTGRALLLTDEVGTERAGLQQKLGS